VSPDGDEPVGSLGEEAAKLFAVLSGLAGAAREQGADLGDSVASLGDRLAGAVHDVDEHLATGATECRYCPVCRTVEALRRTDPEVAQHLAEAAQSLSRAVAGLLATDNVEERRSRSARHHGVEHIDLDDTVDEMIPDDDHEEHR
jgi:hypothetical protein